MLIVPRFRLLVVGCSLFVVFVLVRCWLLVVECVSVVCGCSLVVVGCSSRVACWPLVRVRCWLFVV